MGTSTSVGQFIGKLNQYSQQLATNRGPLEATGMAGKKIFEAHAAQAGVLGSSVAGKRKAIGVRYDLKNRRSNVADGSLVITYTGPAHLVNNPTQRHFIGAKRLGTRTGLRGRSKRVGATAAFGGSNRGAFGQLRNVRNAKQALTIGGNLRAYAFHPGTSGKGFAQRAIVECRTVLPGVLARKLVTEPLKQIFG